ncbi:MAG: DUF4160 domain-containing protein [Spirochaetia bacterium]|jgi:hypothetical protein
MAAADDFPAGVFIYYNDHMPPYFHAEHGEFEAVHAIERLDILRGRLPNRAHGMVIEWALLQREALRSNWAMARDQVPLEKTSPLEWGKSDGQAWTESEGGL